MPRATVIVPTHEHASTLPHAVASALAQTVTDLEVTIVGDGATPDTRAAAIRLAAADDRVRFVDNPKGAGLGFEHRHSAVLEAAGDFLLYLADDDLWLPDHVERVLEVGRTADFVNSIAVMVRPGGPEIKEPVDLSLGVYRRQVLEGKPTLQMAAIGHSAAAYRRVERAWRGRRDHKCVWRRFVEHPDIQAAGTCVPTVLVFPSDARTTMTADQRAEELRRWAQTVADPEGHLRLVRRLLSDELRRSAGRQDKLAGLRRKLQDTRAKKRGSGSGEKLPGDSSPG